MKRIAVSALFIMLSWGGAAHAANQTVTKAIENFIRPAYARLSDQASVLRVASETLCKAPSVDNLNAARGAFRFTVRDWSEIELVRFGPITEENRLERFLFWPDRKGLGLKQVQSAIATQDKTATDAASLKQKSVAMQGLGALEYVLFGAGAQDLSTAAGAYRCQYGSAIAANLATMAGDVSAAWKRPDGIAAIWANPRPENAQYRNDSEAVTELMNVFVHGLEMVRDVRLNGFLGKDGADDKPKLAIYWRSGSTDLALASNLAGLRKLFDASGVGDLATGDNAYIPGSIAFEFNNAALAVKPMSGIPIESALQDAALHGKLDYFRVVTSSLSDLFGVRLSAALGLSAGFSSLDGD